ncbi:replication restart helicase PriA [Flagellimonas zhangzhouensis]|uniref:Replication restart protein PriA n=1 Tax=Flagellimonas zhangzhouensis TaxID=1073328 RepID=A0A1H2RWN3_9FLAO|nr:primosomal protein N' [Allomuricauda zhangzhouensis]SDQ68298.1 replication restart DNA helicase PriA [Allomuricauda zhangzhouensis]SDW23705.1 replication restart DNA helicase PriA [Allomuricauda zhangzhouensis]
MEYFLDVVLPIPLEKLFTYKITSDEADFIQAGMRVAVPFGKSKIYTGLAYRIHEEAPQAYEAKEIFQILDEQPVVTAIQLKHWHWLADYYMCTLGEVIRSALPTAFLLESETLVLPNKNAEVDEMELKDDEFLVYEALQHQSALKISEVCDIVDRKNVLKLINTLVYKGVILQKEELYEQYKPKMVRYVKLSDQYEDEAQLADLLNELTRAPKQSQVVLSLFQLKAKNSKPIPISDLEKESGSSKAVIKALIDKNVLEEYHIRKDRVEFEGDSEDAKTINLNEHQAKALEDINQGFEEDKPVLLHGVTSAGKTEVYVKLIQKCLEEGRQALYLLPEIALTSQLINRLQHYFGEQVSVYHSKYSIHERVEVWNNVLKNEGKAQIVIGARSSLFLPFSNLGLVVVDEEHENSFKQFDPAPRYHARDAAVVLAALHKANIILGSATPSIESMYNARTDKYGYATIKYRYGDVLMPEINLVDIKEATRKKKMKGHFSETLIKAITEALEEGEQIILFQNRRGFAPVVECTTCGHVAQCPNCDVSLTFHQHRNQLRCHYCGYHMALQQACLACGSNTLDKKGFGTEQIQEELGQLFPEIKVGRMDLDTTRGKYAYEKIISAFENQEMDILVGTQMVTKGLDFRNVSLVGIMNADSMLNFPDYRAHERSFQMLTQVAGRAGRTQKRGKVLIQSYNPYHQILQQVTTNNYDKMFEEQFYEREQFKYPPLVRLIKITLKDKDYNKLNEASDWLAGSLRNVLGNQILGPEYPPVARIRRDYLKNILIKLPRKQPLAQTKNSIKRIEKSFNAISKYKSVRLVYNVDHI